MNTQIDTSLRTKLVAAACNAEGIKADDIRRAIIRDCIAQDIELLVRVEEASSQMRKRAKEGRYGKLIAEFQKSEEGQGFYPVYDVLVLELQVGLKDEILLDEPTPLYYEPHDFDRNRLEKRAVEPTARVYRLNGRWFPEYHPGETLVSTALQAVSVGQQKIDHGGLFSGVRHRVAKHLGLDESALYHQVFDAEADRLTRTGVDPQLVLEISRTFPQHCTN